ncbi:MAG TPA: hypothetical protein VK186_09540 [Candidatus Deferrimicrobium sp.]|nr:hypothetical protein [Candidatus Deferrimicrobium sp.]
MNKMLFLTSYQVGSPSMLLKALIFLSQKKTRNKNSRESNIPIFVLKPGKYPDFKRYSGSPYMGAQCRLIKSKKTKKRR